MEPVQIWPPRELVKVYQNLGVSQRLGLHGRPPRPIGALGTSKVGVKLLFLFIFYSSSIKFVYILLCVYRGMFVPFIVFILSFEEVIRNIHKIVY